MATESLKIVIGADLGAAISAINSLSVTIKGVGDAAQDTAGLLAKIPAALRPIDPVRMNVLRDAVASLKKDIANLPKPLIPPIPPIPDPFKKVVPGANAAGFALTNVGRVAQDLPFGFIGIQNNLNPLLESFQRLKAETGSSSAAFKALGSSLIGPAGIGIALSVVSSAIVIFQNGISGFNKKTKEAKEEADKFVDSLKSIADVTNASAASVQGEIAQVTSLANAVQNANLPYAERKRALDQLKQTNKEYFGDLKLEDAITGKLAATVNEYTKALVQQAVIKGFSDEISKVAVELAKQDKALKSSQDNLIRLRSELGKTKESETSLTGEDRISQKYVDAKDAVSDADKAFKDQRTTVEKLRTNFVELQGAIDGAVTESLKFRDLQSPEKAKAETDALKKRLDALEKIKDSLKDFSQIADIEELIFDLKVKILLRDAKKNGLSDDEIEAAKRGFKLQLSDAFEKETLSLEASPKVKVQFPQIDTRPAEEAFSEFAKKLSKIPILTENQVRARIGFKIETKFDLVKEVTEKLEQQLGQIEINTKEILVGASVNLNQIIEQSLTEGFAGVGEGLGEALVSGLDFSNILKPLVGAVSGLLSSIGKLMIQSGVKILLAKRALTLAISNPAILIAGGIALVALAAALKKSFGGQKIGSFEKGGISSGPRSGYLAMLHGTELIIPMNKIDKRPSRGGIQGQAAVNITLQAGSVIEGQALRILLNRVDRSNGRLF